MGEPTRAEKRSRTPLEKHQWTKPNTKLERRREGRKKEGGERKEEGELLWGANNHNIPKRKSRAL